MTADGPADTRVSPKLDPVTPNPSAIRRTLSVVLPPLLLGTVSAVTCYLSAGASLGLFLGGLLMVTLLAPPLSIADERVVDRLLALVALTLPICAAWAVGTARSPTYWTEWAACCVVLICYAAALAGLSAILRTLRFPALAASAVTVALALAWMSWPIWLSRTWDGEASAPGVVRLVRYHPPMAVNHEVIRQFGEWTGLSVAYHLTDLSQNVSYALPRSVWPCATVHALLAAALLAMAELVRRRQTSPPRQARSDSDDPDSDCRNPGRR